VSSIPLDDTRPLLPRRPRRGSVLSGYPRAADDGGPHTKIAPRTPQGRDSTPPARSLLRQSRSPAIPAPGGRRAQVPRANPATPWHLTIRAGNPALRRDSSARFPRYNGPTPDALGKAAAFHNPVSRLTGLTRQVLASDSSRGRRGWFDGAAPPEILLILGILLGRQHGFYPYHLRHRRLAGPHRR
jgi:hypothetical protein